MPRCGDCSNFLTQMTNSAASSGFCKGILDEDGLGKEVGIYDDAGSCQMFMEQERIRTNVSEFMYDPHVRMTKGFDEK